jgi:Flp pilus assembly protein TadG
MSTMRKEFARRLRLLPRGERGTQLVELAIVLPILLALFAATAEFGCYFYTYATLAKATRAGARYLAAAPVKVSQGGANAVEDEKAKRLVVFGDPNVSDSAKPLLPGLTTANVSIQRAGGVTSVPDTVTIKIVNYTYKPLLNLGGFGDKIKWTAVPVKPSTTMRYLLTQPSP